MAAPHGRAMPVAGEIVADKYRVLRVIGSGGMGCVVAAEHISLRQLVAVKFAYGDTAHRAEITERFAREARAAAAIQSEHVARVIDVGIQSDGTPYMVMEHLVGTDLRELLRARGPLPIVEVVDYLLQVCEAMAEAHALGIVHRDLKPANVFLAQRVDGVPVVKVLDFGIAKTDFAGGEAADANLTGTDVVMGSVRYMSPEQLRGLRNADARSDIWSLGVIAYELSTGVRPFEGDSLPEAMMKIAADPPRPPPPGLVSPPFGAVLLRCLEKDPGARPQTIADLARALAPFGPPSAAVSLARIQRSQGAGSQHGPAAAAFRSVAMTTVLPTSVTAGPGHDTQRGLAGTARLTAPRTSSRQLWIATGCAVVAGGAATAFLVPGWGNGDAAPSSSAASSAPAPPSTSAATDVESKIDAERLASFSALAAVRPPATKPEAARIALGAKLFADPRLSKNDDVACTTCHLPEKFGTDGMKRSRGSDGLESPRNTPSIYNMSGYFALLWDGRRDTLFDQAKDVLQSPRAMAATPALLEVKLRNVPEYVSAFSASFPGEHAPVSFDNVARALASYEETLVSPGPWDRFIEGDDAALTGVEKAGFNRFVDLGCVTCHFGPHVGATMFQKTGLVKAWPDSKDRGRFEVTQKPSDWMIFRVPSLRNVAKTAPYFHDGSVASLDTAIRMMALHQLGKEIDDRDTALLRAWLETLTGDAEPPRAAGAPTATPAATPPEP